MYNLVCCATTVTIFLPEKVFRFSFADCTFLMVPFVFYLITASSVVCFFLAPLPDFAFVEFWSGVLNCAFILYLAVFFTLWERGPSFHNYIRIFFLPTAEHLLRRWWSRFRITSRSVSAVSVKNSSIKGFKKISLCSSARSIRKSKNSVFGRLSHLLHSYYIHQTFTLHHYHTSIRCEKSGSQLQLRTTRIFTVSWASHTSSAQTYKKGDTTTQDPIQTSVLPIIINIGDSSLFQDRSKPTALAAPIQPSIKVSILGTKENHKSARYTKTVLCLPTYLHTYPSTATFSVPA